INLFQCNTTEIYRIYVKANNTDFNFLNEADFKFFLENPTHQSFEYFTALKKYNEERNVELFKLIQLGGEITNGELFKKLALLVH
ncbi:MAG TPA: DUF6495 family protein, partial [Flavobacteriaceae bacterium]|nr:DUF6495 family protein [Flavobacteriaceae bacterium]